MDTPREPGPAGDQASEPKVGRPREIRIDEDVLRETLHEINLRGLGGIRITAIAERAGVSRVSIYARWPNREDLIQEALTNTILAFSKPETGTLRGDLRSLIRQWADIYRDPDLLNIFSRLEAERSQFSDIVNSYYRRVRAPANRMVEQVIVAARDRGELREGVNVKVTARVIVGALRLQTQLEGPVSIYFERQLYDFIWNAIAAE